MLVAIWAFLAGFVTMSVEMVAPRLLAPTLGTTQIVWSNIIASVLAGLALGAACGGRIADRWPTRRACALVIVAAGAAITALPALANLILDQAADAVKDRSVSLFLTTLVSVCLLFLPPVFLLGMVGPYAVKLASERETRIGRVAGTLAALASAGSIAGTLVTSVAMIPLLGTRRTLMVVGTALAMSGLREAVRSNAVRTLLLLYFIACSTMGRASVRSTPGQLFAREGLYQFVEIVQTSDQNIELRTDEGVGAQSIRASDGLAGTVWDEMASLAVAADVLDGSFRLLILGLGGGSVALEVERQLPGSQPIRVHGIELDPTVVEAARRYLGLGAVTSMRIDIADARVGLGRVSETFDVIVCDSYRGFYVPFHLATVEFFEEVKSHLVPGGALIVNLAALSGSEQLQSAFITTMRNVFPHVYRLPPRKNDRGFENLVFLATDRSVDEIVTIAPLASQSVVRRLSAAVAPPSAHVLTDDKAPVEALTDFSILTTFLGPGR